MVVDDGVGRCTAVGRDGLDIKMQHFSVNCFKCELQARVLPTRSHQFSPNVRTNKVSQAFRTPGFRWRQRVVFNGSINALPDLNSPQDRAVRQRSREVTGDSNMNALPAHVCTALMMQWCILGMRWSAKNLSMREAVRFGNTTRR